MPEAVSLSSFSHVLSANSSDDFLHRTAEHLCQKLAADGCDILITQSDGTLVLRASTHGPEFVHRCRLGPGIGLCGRVLLSGQPEFISKGARVHPSNVAYPGFDERDYEAAAVVPFAIGEGMHAVGLLVWNAPQRFSKSECEALIASWSNASSLLTVFFLGEQLGSRSQRIGAVSEVSRNIASSPYLDEILQLLVNITAQQFNYAVCTVRLLDEGREELVLRATQAPAKAYQRKPAIKLGESIAGKALSESRTIIVPDVQLDPEYIGHDLAKEQGLRSMACVPLMVQNRLIGVLSCYSSEVRTFTDDEIKALETVAKQAAFSIEHAKLQVRTTLMQEMHHRVKNNLQQVASLIRLELNHGKSRTLEESLSDTLGRILTISAVHDLLSRDDLDHVGLTSLAESLVQHHRDALMLPDKRIDFRVTGDNVHLPTFQATQAALLLNELIQNAIEHGFKTSTVGEIHITIEALEDQIGLWVSNNGDALDFAAESHALGSLGLQIVTNIARSLGGHFRLETRLGWTVAEAIIARVTPE